VKFFAVNGVKYHRAFEYRQIRKPKTMKLAKVGFSGWLAALLLCICGALAVASNQYTAKQLEAFATRVGQIYWTQSVNGNGPSFSSAPSANAKLFRIDAVESFQITELVGQTTDQVYYKIRRENGQEAFIRPELFLEALNVTIMPVDPMANEKKKAAEAAEEDKRRIEWIRAQPWSPIVKEAAIKKKPTPGLTTAEVKHVLGQPKRVAKVQGPIKVAEEQWFYPDGSVLIFHNGLLSRVEGRERK
jgi:hypothetical protein